MDDTRADSATESIANRATFYFPRFAADPHYGLHLMRQIDYSCYAGSRAFLSTPSDLVRFGWRSTAASCCTTPPRSKLLQTPQRLASGRRRVTVLLGPETVALAGEHTHAAGHDGEALVAWWRL